MNKIAPSDKDIETFLGFFGDDIDRATAALRQYSLKKQTLIKRANAPLATGSVLVRLTDTSKEYKIGKQPVQALNNVSLEIRAGEFIALTGTSGSGKSTLLQLIGGL